MDFSKGGKGKSYQLFHFLRGWIKVTSYFFEGVGDGWRELHIYVIHIFFVIYYVNVYCKIEYIYIHIILVAVQYPD